MSRFPLALTGLLLAASPAPARAAQACVTDTVALATLSSRLLAVVNLGDPRALRAAIDSLWPLDRMSPDAGARLQETLGHWSIRSGPLTPLALCAITPAQGYLLVRGPASPLIDSVLLRVGPTGARLAGFGIVPGVRARLAPEDTGSDAGRVRALATLVRHLGHRGGFAGEVLLARDGEVLYHEAVGQSDPASGATARPGLPYSVASVGKLFTGTAIMRLVESGRLTLRDSLGAYLTPAERPAAGGAVRIEHLLTHTDGLVRGSDTLHFPPGTRFAYVNYGYYLLGRIIERVTGQSLAAAYQSLIFAPAGMTQTRRLERSEPDPDLPPGQVLGYDSTGLTVRINPELQTIPATGAGGFFSTVEDLFRFAQALTQGRLVSPATLDTMRRPRRELGASEYGYGVDLYRGGFRWGHSGGIPGATAEIQWYGDSGYVLIYLSNRGSPDPIRQLADALVGERPFRSGGATPPGA